MSNNWWLTDLGKTVGNSERYNNFMDEHVRERFLRKGFEEDGTEYTEHTSDLRAGIGLFLVINPVGWVISVVTLVVAWTFLPILSAVGCGLYADKKARHNKMNVRLVMVLLCALGSFMGTSAIQNSVAPAAADAPAAEQVAR